MKRDLAIVFLVFVMGCLFSCSGTEEKAAARIGDRILTVAMLKDQYLAITPESRPDLTTIDDKEQFARDVIGKEILLAEARSMGLDRLPEVTNARKATIQRKAWQVFYDEQVRSKVKVSEEEIQDLYAKQRYRYHVGWIFLRSRALAEEISRRLKAGEDFAELASAYSMDASRDNGGDLGARALGTMPSNVEDVVMQMSPGDVTDPIQYETYYVIIKLYSKQEVELPPLESARDGLMSMARARRETARQRELVEQYKGKYGLTFNDDVLDLIAKKTADLYTSGDAEPGLIPEFSDEELARTVAQYEDGEWQVRTYVERMRSQNKYLRPARGADQEMIKSVISDFITGDLWLAEIRDAGYDRRPEVAKLGDRAMEEAMVTAIHEDLVREVEVDEDKLRQFYEGEKAELVTDPGARLAVITLGSDEEAEETYQALERGAAFENLARERSLDKPSGEAGGALSGPIFRRQLEQFPDIQEAVENLSVGNYSRPIPVPMGFLTGQVMIIKVLEKIEPRQLEYEEIKGMLSQRVLQVEQDKVFWEWLEGKMTEYGAETYPEVLGAIDFAELKELET